MKNLLFALLVALASTGSGKAVPVTYYVDHSPIGHFTGRFTLDVGTALGTYYAESFWGVHSLPPNPDDPWTSVVFEAKEGSCPVLTLNLPHGYMAFRSPPVSGDTILPDSTAIMEWSHLIAYSNQRSPGKFTVVSVPDSGPSVVVVAAVLAGLVLVQHRKERPRFL